MAITAASRLPAAAAAAAASVIGAAGHPHMSR